LFTQGDIKKLATYPDLKVSVSLDGPTAEVHEMIRGEGTFTRTTEAIRALSKNGVFVGVNMFIHQGNVNLVEETLTLSHSIGVQAFNCLNMMQVGRANSCQSQQELQRIPEHVLYELLFEILRRNPHHRKMMRNSTFANQIMGIAAGVKSHYCGIGTNRAIYVRADGNVYPCPDTVLPEFCLGNIRQDDLEEIWEKSPLLEKLRRLNVDTMNASCAKCDVRYICGGGCRGENYQVTGKLESPHFNCNEWRRSILNMMWMLVDEPSFFEEKVKELYDKVGI
ncbi:MAG: SPASM domain-containing protein, partial [Candidatus Peribacteraceae bacterium]|nr:SPASM domain-containing protein [Candidatus Peribacteraceae bacterium]